MAITSEFVVVKKEINPVVDGFLSNSALISVVPDDDIKGLVNIVVGAEYYERTGCCFSKDSLKELIDTLQEIYDVME